MQTVLLPSANVPDPDVPDPVRSDVGQLRKLLEASGLRAAIGFLNRRTPHRFTGIFRFDGEMLRSVELLDKWDATVARGEDIPIANAYCAHLKSSGDPLNIADGRADPRVPWMNNSPIVSYCGVAIEDAAGEPWGALCHFDLQPCDIKDSDMPLMLGAAKLFARALGV